MVHLRGWVYNQKSGTVVDKFGLYDDEMCYSIDVIVHLWGQCKWRSLRVNLIIIWRYLKDIFAPENY